MRTDFLYGRKAPVGYISLNSDFSKEDEEQFFSKMVGYIPVLDANGGELRGSTAPEKLFFYNLDLRNIGAGIVWGKSMQTPPNEFSDPGRYTDFSHQIVYTDKERDEALGHIAHILNPNIFFSDFRSAYKAVNSSLNRKEDDDIGIYEYAKVNVDHICSLFGLTENKIESLMYAVLCSDRKIYISLPKTDKTGTDAALELMRLILHLLPRALVSRTGFVTYINSVADEYISSGTNFVFFANNSKNVAFVKRNQNVFCFIPGINETNVEIPDKIKPLTRLMVEAFRFSEIPAPLQQFYTALERYLRPESREDISETEYEGIYNFIGNVEYLTQCIRTEVLPEWKEEKVWENIDLLSLMLTKRSFLWNSNLEKDLVEFEKEFIKFGIAQVNKNVVHRLYVMYEKKPELQDEIILCFTSRIHNVEDVTKYLNLLRDYSSMREDVSQKIVGMIKRYITDDTLEEALYPLLVGYYVAGQIDSGLVEKYFASKCLSLDNIEKIKQVCYVNGEGAGVKLWRPIKQIVYRDSDKRSMAVARECNKINTYIKKANQDALGKCKGIWSTIELIGTYSALLYEEKELKDCITENIEKIVFSCKTVKEAKKVLVDSVNSYRRLKMPKDYKDYFSRISEKYLVRHKEDIYVASKENREIIRWPLIADDNETIKNLKNRINTEEKNANVMKKFEKNTLESAQKTLVYLQTEMSKETREFLLTQPEFLKKRINNILLKTTKETGGKKSNHGSERVFDDIHTQLLLSFPEYNTLICKNIMTSPQGGILSVISIYMKVQKNPNIDMQKLRKDLKEVIINFYQEYDVCRYEKRVIKRNKDFLRKELDFKGYEYSMLLK